MVFENINMTYVYIIVAIIAMIIAYQMFYGKCKCNGESKEEECTCKE